MFNKDFKGYATRLTHKFCILVLFYLESYTNPAIAHSYNMKTRRQQEKPRKRLRGLVKQHFMEFYSFFSPTAFTKQHFRHVTGPFLRRRVCHIAFDAILKLFVYGVFHTTNRNSHEMFDSFDNWHNCLLSIYLKYMVLNSIKPLYTSLFVHKQHKRLVF